MTLQFNEDGLKAAMQEFVRQTIDPDVPIFQSRTRQLLLSENSRCGHTASIRRRLCDGRVF